MYVETLAASQGGLWLTAIGIAEKLSMCRGALHCWLLSGVRCTDCGAMHPAERGQAERGQQRTAGSPTR